MRTNIWILFAALMMLLSCTEETILEDIDNEFSRTIDRVEVEYLFDNVSYELKQYDPVTDRIVSEIISGVEHQAEFTSIAGVSEQVGRAFQSDFEGNVVLGKALTGWLIYANPSDKAEIAIYQERRFTSAVVGNVVQKFEIEVFNIPYKRSYVDDYSDLEIKEYSFTGENACANVRKIEYSEKNDEFEETLRSIGCGSRAYVTVKVHFK